MAERRWDDRPSGFRAWERTAGLGDGEEVWRWAREELLAWRVKTRSGFTVRPDAPVAEGDRPTIVAHVFGLAIREPVEVVEVVDTDDRAGFAYRTLPGHPVSGEEAFIVHRAGGSVELTIRSLTRAATSWRWRAVYPLLLIAQALARYRYMSALRVRAPRR
ncbi:DUF1990 family protein [Microbacterium timonense]|uniref:DUF1990 family protein n=1 Tax=Microbacterium timonense TaxID=2086576 RepID=UPI00190E9CF8|nr:DUF1990 family protein [Microbacterium timonense]